MTGRGSINVIDCLSVASSTDALSSSKEYSVAILELPTHKGIYGEVCDRSNFVQRLPLVAFQQSL